MQTIYFLHLIFSVTLIGLIWTMQIVHYPSFARVSAEGFTDFHRFHLKRARALTAPLMFLDLATALVLWSLGLNSALRFLLTFNLMISAAPLVLTFLIQMPLHKKLQQGQDHQTIQELIKSNWARTLIWTLKLLPLSVLFKRLF